MNNETLNWEAELRKSATKYHTVGSWVAVFFNIIFFASDYLSFKEFSAIFLELRLIDSGIIFISILCYNRFRFPSEIVVFIAVIVLSIQNAIMWSMMNAPQMQKHTMAYVVLFIGAGMLVLWNIRYSIAMIVISLMANVITFILFSRLPISEILVNGGMLTASVACFSAMLIHVRQNLTRKEIISRLSLEVSNKKLNEQNIVIEEKNTSITDSIRYAKRIQSAILPKEELIRESLPESFILFLPRDIVSGDFYWFDYHRGKSFIAAVDCTGHGVPGAFMSLIGNNMLNLAMADVDKLTPANILNEMKKSITSIMQQGESKDGMDMALCIVDHENKKLEFAGAMNPLYRIRNKELEIFKGDKMPIGAYVKTVKEHFENYSLDLEKGDIFYIFSDGYADQFGGNNNKKFSSRRFGELLLSIHHLPMAGQKEILTSTLNNWKGEYKQLDDVLVIGFVPFP
jgi:serine phosphatase RsbU (regulator of sigma subunit)